jgi:hypothetical protein
MQLLDTDLGSEGLALRRWIYTSLAILSAAITTWVLHVTQETWRPPVVAEQQIRIGVASSNPEIEALEAELVRIQSRLDDLRSSTRP